MPPYHHIKERLAMAAKQTSPDVATRFFKTGPGQYGAHDQFLGVSVPFLRSLARDFADLSLEDIGLFLTSPVNEERLLALILLVDQYKKGTSTEKNTLHTFYKEHLTHVNNWNLVDLSAPTLMGVPLLDTDKTPLLDLVASPDMWRRRVAIVSTLAFIRHNQFGWTVRLCERLLNDPEDLMHKATGWMLREVGKRDLEVLKTFLNKHLPHMPRTTLRYAIERFAPEERKDYLTRKV